MIDPADVTWIRAGGGLPRGRGACTTVSTVLIRRESPNRLVVEPRTADVQPWLRAAVARYAIALGIITVVVLLRFVLQPLVRGELPFLLQFIGVVAASAFCGLGPGLVATVAGAVAGQYLFVADGEVSHGWRNPLSALSNSPELRRFVIEGSLVSALGAWLHHARRRAQVAEVARGAMERQMVEVGDNERRRFGHDLHDGLGQQLTGIALLSESLAHRLASQHLPAQAEQAEQITALVTEAIGWTRELARGLSPLMLETEGLLVALENLADGATRLFGIDCSLECDETEVAVAQDSAVHVYRIIQEAISNSVKHGKAKHVRVRVALDRGPREHVVITVEDDGSGLSAKTVANPGLGLQIMRYRANLIGAKLAAVRAGPDGGTLVTCEVPAATARTPAGSGSATAPVESLVAHQKDVKT